MNDTFEGYVGIRLWDGQVMNDILFTLLCSILFLFALMFRFNYRAFLKMLQDVVSTKERSGLFEKKTTADYYFRLFMIFQTLALCSLFAFSYMNVNGYLTFEPTGKATFLCLGAIMAITVLFYYFKRSMYALTATIFTDGAKYKTWKNSYVSIMGIWGVVLYIPVVWSLLWGMFPAIPAILFIISYILCRFAITYKTLRIFHNKNSGLFYISLYLCVQEILPLVFLYEGMVYLYNFIKTSTLWH